jgi:hypothetical protein
VFTVRYELSFYLLCRRNTCLKGYKLERVTNGDPDKNRLGNKSDGYYPTPFMSLKVSVC